MHDQADTVHRHTRPPVSRSAPAERHPRRGPHRPGARHAAGARGTRTGTATPVRLAPGGKAWVKLTFVQVQGEADGYCKSGATPSVFPTLVVGLPGAGRHQVALTDGGVFAQCDDKVTVTPVSSSKPA
ncbi:DUF4232 domain-containing protein [Streptomyces sp. NPDC053076]|uniref:DUF4232 domain-containing protein n=1 Tax=Streptomyces sp. NPDC053076 TaxID=3365696 RepID=UPI0037D86FE0